MHIEQLDLYRICETVPNQAEGAFRLGALDHDHVARLSDLSEKTYTLINKPFWQPDEAPLPFMDGKDRRTATATQQQRDRPRNRTA